MPIPRKEKLWVGCGTFLAVYCFFLEYLWPLRRVHLFSDIEGYHWPLLSYAYQALREGRFPQWDSGIYCGISFVGNPQAALFYPPNWLLFAFSFPRKAISYVTLEFVDVLHFWIALLLVYLWLRDRGYHLLTALLAGLCFAFSGYVMGDIQHLGATNSYTWFPLALWGIDEASRMDSYRPLWKLTAGSALSFLAGYPPEWAVLAACALTYALCLPHRRRIVPAALAALILSLGICAIQILPTLEASKLKVAAKYYGDPLPWLLLSNLFLPNRFDQSRSVPMGLGEEQYLYIGAPGLFALLWLIATRRWRPALPGIAIAALSLWMIRNPFGWTGALLDVLPRFNEIVRNWNFLAGLALASTLLTAVAVEDTIARPSKPRLIPFALGACALWCAWLWYVWIPGGRDFGAGWKSAIEAAITLLIFAALLRAPKRGIVTAAILFLVYTEFKVYGTNRRFSASQDDINRFFAPDARTGGPGMLGVDDAVYRQLKANPHYRIALLDSLVHDDMRHYRLSTPQGLDPMLPAQYRREVERFLAFHSDREFLPDPFHDASLRQLGVRYLMVPQSHAAYKRLRSDPRWRLMEPSTSFFHVFEYQQAEPIFAFANGSAKPRQWTPEQRRMEVEASMGGPLIFKEQYAPGWTATIDGARVPIARESLAFQKIEVPAGKHIIVFTYSSPALPYGAALTLASLLILAVSIIKVR
ncbi:MAG: YfhO family protein [Bryobacteraceae bacterium]